MKKLITFIFCCYVLFFLFSCKRNSRTLSFCEKPNIHNTYICMVIKNDSKEKYAYYIPSSIDDDWKYNMGTYIIIKDEEGREPVSNSVFFDKLMTKEHQMISFRLNEKKDSLFWKKLQSQNLKVDYLWVKIYRYMQMNKFILFPNEKRSFYKKIVFSKKQLEKSGAYYMFEKNKKYFIHVEMDFDSTKIKQYLTPLDLDSLKKNNIKIFHGKLSTERVSLIVNLK